MSKTILSLSEISAMIELGFAQQPTVDGKCRVYELIAEASVKDQPVRCKFTKTTQLHSSAPWSWLGYHTWIQDIHHRTGLDVGELHKLFPQNEKVHGVSTQNNHLSYYYQSDYYRITLEWKTMHEFTTEFKLLVPYAADSGINYSENQVYRSFHFRVGDMVRFMVGTQTVDGVLLVEGPIPKLPNKSADLMFNLRALGFAIFPGILDGLAKVKLENSPKAYADMLVGMIPALTEAMSKAGKLNEQIVDTPEATMAEFPVSTRGLPLMDQVNPECSILTVENYCKWYGFHLISPSGEVTPVSSERGLKLVEEKYQISGYCDHALHPMVLVLQAKEMGVCWGQQAFELMMGRWMLEVEYDHGYKTPLDWLNDRLG